MREYGCLRGLEAEAVCRCKLTAKRNQSGCGAAATLADTLVVDQPAALVEQLIKQRHVLLLRFDDVGEDQVRLSGEERAIDWLLDAEDGRCVAQVGREHGTGIGVL